MERESWLPLKRRPTRKRRPHKPGWISPKIMMAGIREQLVPAALALGWIPTERRPGRKGERRFGEFEFERLGPDRIEHMGLDFQYGAKPKVFLCLALWAGEGGVCTSFRSGGCNDHSEMFKPLWRSLLDKLRRNPSPDDPLAGALNKGLQRLQMAEAYFQEGAEHPDLRMFLTQGPPRWPDGYADRMT